MAYTKEILTLAVEIGDAMLRNGGEIYRVEDSVIRILKTYEIEDFDVYVLSNGIFASANEDKEDSCSMVRHVPLGDTHLGRLSALNQLTRDICSRNCSLIDSWERLEECKRIPKYPNYIQVLFCGLGCCAFSYMFGGKPIDSLFAFFIAAFEQVLLIRFSTHNYSRFIKNVMASIYVASITLILAKFIPAIHPDFIIIGSIMPLVPGIALTTSIRDFYNGDYLSGTIHLIDALLTAICIAVGICIPFFLAKTIGGGII